MASGGAYGSYDGPAVAATAAQRLPSVQDLDVTVLAFAQWLSEMRSRSNSSLQQMLAEMGIIRNGITSNNTDLAEFKRNTATVQQQMQSQISDLRDKLTDAYTEIANLKKTKSGFEQEVHAEYQSLSEQLQFKTLELETLKKAYAHTHQQLQQQIIQLQTEVNELRFRGDDAHKQTHMDYEHNVNKVSEVEMAVQYADNEVKRIRSDHDQAIANLAENMNRWNDTLRDLSKEFHDFQRVMSVNHQRIQSNLWDVQAKAGLAPSGRQVSAAVLAEGGGDDARNPPSRQGGPLWVQSPGAAPAGAAAAPGQRRTAGQVSPAPPYVAGAPAAVAPAGPTPVGAGPVAAPQGPYMMR